mmetsp:Transcript_10582/g.13735  ORF Transcript_10582/g.13735 Transcript_10582/m.13735 type:complete len:188 (+) Transcript_10582:96-659(+)
MNGHQSVLVFFSSLFFLIIPSLPAFQVSLFPTNIAKTSLVKNEIHGVQKVHGIFHASKESKFQKDKNTSSLMSSVDDNDLPDFATREKIEELLGSNTIVVFMKGTKLMPSCGFSNTVVAILNSLNAPFEAVDVLQNEKVRNEIKKYSNWPTIPQVYVNGEFIGGSDILIEMYQTGELQEMIEIALAS